MQLRFPYFYFDVVARIIPGAFALTVLMTRVIPSFTKELWKYVNGENISILASFVAAAVCISCAYVVGIVFEALAGTIILRIPVDGIVDFSFWSAARMKTWHYPTGPMEPRDATTSIRELRFNTWNWFVHQGSPQWRDAFSHAHRFQAESKLCLFSSIVAISWLMLTLRGASPGFSLHHERLTAATIAALGLLAHLQRERRRWQQVMASIDELNAQSQKPNTSLQASLERLKSPGSLRSHLINHICTSRLFSFLGDIRGFTILLCFILSITLVILMAKLTL